MLGLVGGEAARVSDWKRGERRSLEVAMIMWERGSLGISLG